MYAIIKTGGKQYKAEPDKFIDVESLMQKLALRFALRLLWL